MIKLEVLRTDITGTFADVQPEDIEELIYNNNNDEEVVLAYEFEDYELAKAEKCFCTLANVCKAQISDDGIAVQYLTMYQELNEEIEEQCRETIKNYYPRSVA